MSRRVSYDVIAVFMNAANSEKDAKTKYVHIGSGSSDADAGTASYCDDFWNAAVKKFRPEGFELYGMLTVNRGTGDHRHFMGLVS